MLITSQYKTENSKQVFQEFVCQLDTQTELVFTFNFTQGVERKCKVETRDIETQVVQSESSLDYVDSRDLLKVLNTISIQLQEMEKNDVSTVEPTE